VILIVSFLDNEHVEEVRRHLTTSHVVLDMAWFPAQLGLDAWAGDGGTRMQLKHPSGELIDLAEVGAVWYRRIRPFEVHEELTDPTSRLFAWSESNEAMLGVWYTLPCFWMNPPLGDEVAQRKITSSDSPGSSACRCPRRWSPTIRSGLASSSTTMGPGG